MVVKSLELPAWHADIQVFECFGSLHCRMYHHHSRTQLTLQDAVWAEQAHVFPDWRIYSAELSQRAALAGRHWYDSIGVKSDVGGVGAKSEVGGGRKSDVVAVSASVVGVVRKEELSSVMRVGVLGRATAWLHRVTAGLDMQ